jgi:hypothetical protein
MTNFVKTGQIWLTKSENPNSVLRCERPENATHVRRYHRYEANCVVLQPISIYLITPILAYALDLFISARFANYV